MQMVLTRDSALLWLGLIVTLITYMLSSKTDVDHWTLRDWLQFALVAASWGMGKLQTSPLPHSEEGSARIPESGR